MMATHRFRPFGHRLTRYGSFLMARFLIVPVVPFRSIRAILGAVVAAAAVTHEPAIAQGRFEANYSISAARITIGNASVTAQIGETEYSGSMTGRGSGVLRILASGDGNMTVQGQVR